VQIYELLGTAEAECEAMRDRREIGGVSRPLRASGNTAVDTFLAAGFEKCWLVMEMHQVRYFLAVCRGVEFLARGPELRSIAADAFLAQLSRWKPSLAAIYFAARGKYPPFRTGPDGSASSGNGLPRDRRRKAVSRTGFRARKRNAKERRSAARNGLTRS